MSDAEIVLVDEVNAYINADDSIIEYLQNKTKIFDKKAIVQAAYKIGAWDGNVSLLESNGDMFMYMVPKVFKFLEEIGAEVDIIDKRRQNVSRHPLGFNSIEDDHFNDVGVGLRPYQTEAVNMILDNEKGIIDCATAGGKTFICGAVVKLYEEVYRTITIVPSEYLVNQTYKDYKLFDINVTRITGKTPKNKLAEEFAKQHVVCTWQKLKNCLEYINDVDVVLYDEAHVLGEVMERALCTTFRHSHIRVGFTGTVPKDKLKREKLFCVIGGKVLYRVPPKYLMDEGYISTLDITVIPIETEMRLFDNWDDESDYLMFNIQRLTYIAQIINNIPKKNTIILCHAAQAPVLANILDLEFITKDTVTSKREELLNNFDTMRDYRLVATYGTVGTGISKNDVFQMVLVDVGPNDTRMIQGIGRGLRLDSDGVHHIDVFDIYQELGYSHRHFLARQREYKQLKYKFNVLELSNF